MGGVSHAEKIAATLPGQDKKAMHQKIRDAYVHKSEEELAKDAGEMEYLPAMQDANAMFEGADAEDIARLPHQVSAWNNEEVCLFLKCIGFPQYTPAFQAKKHGGLSMIDDHEAV